MKPAYERAKLKTKQTRNQEAQQRGVISSGRRHLLPVSLEAVYSTTSLQPHAPYKRSKFLMMNLNEFKSRMGLLTARLQKEWNLNWMCKEKGVLQVWKQLFSIMTQCLSLMRWTTCVNVAAFVWMNALKHCQSYITGGGGGPEPEQAKRTKPT